MDFVQQLARQSPRFLSHGAGQGCCRRRVPSFCLLPGGTFKQVRNLVLDRWKATVLGGIARARSGSGMRACVSLLLIE